MRKVELLKGKGDYCWRCGGEFNNYVRLDAGKRLCRRCEEDNKKGFIRMTREAKEEMREGLFCERKTR